LGFAHRAVYHVSGSQTAAAAWLDEGQPSAAAEGPRRPQLPGTKPMDELNSSRAPQFAQAAGVFEQQNTGHVPNPVIVVLRSDAPDTRSSPN
jgi:hypothetical protein